MAKIGDAERITQNHVISLFRDKELLDYEYYGNRRAYENSNIEVETLKSFLLGGRLQ
jgi:type I restriction enzyme R subunit